MVSTNPTVPAPARGSVFGYQMRFDLSEGFPLLTTKTASALDYSWLLWFLKGDTNIKYLKDNNVSVGTNGRMKTADLARFTAT